MKHVEREAPAGSEVMAHTREAGEPIGLGEVVQERPERGNDQREPLRQIKGPHVSRHQVHAAPHLGCARHELALQYLEHGVAGVQRVDLHTSLGDRQGHAPGPGTQFEHRSAAFHSLAAVPLDITLERWRRDDVVELWLVGHGFERYLPVAALTDSSTFLASTSSGTFPPSTRVSLKAFPSNFAPSAVLALSRWRLISLCPSL